LYSFTAKAVVEIPAIIITVSKREMIFLIDFFIAIPPIKQRNYTSKL
jgi:hypothetical protein